MCNASSCIILTHDVVRVLRTATFPIRISPAEWDASYRCNNQNDGSDECYCTDWVVVFPFIRLCNGGNTIHGRWTLSNGKCYIEETG